MIAKPAMLSTRMVVDILSSGPERSSNQQEVPVLDSARVQGQNGGLKISGQNKTLLAITNNNSKLHQAYSMFSSISKIKTIMTSYCNRISKPSDDQQPFLNEKRRRPCKAFRKNIRLIHTRNRDCRLSYIATLYNHSTLVLILDSNYSGTN